MVKMSLSELRNSEVAAQRFGLIRKKCELMQGVESRELRFSTRAKRAFRLEGVTCFWEIVCIYAMIGRDGLLTMRGVGRGVAEEIAAICDPYTPYITQDMVKATIAAFTPPIMGEEPKQQIGGNKNEETETVCSG